MNSERSAPRFVDDHRISIAAPRDRVWAAVREYAWSLADATGNPAFALLGTEPHSGFALTRETAESRVELSGRHRFSHYRLVFALETTAEGATDVVALTFADFPGLHGRLYRALVIGSRAHAVAVRRMLRSIRRSSLTG